MNHITFPLSDSLQSVQVYLILLLVITVNGKFVLRLLAQPEFRAWAGEAHHNAMMLSQLWVLDHLAPEGDLSVDTQRHPQGDTASFKMPCSPWLLLTVGSRESLSCTRGQFGLH